MISWSLHLYRKIILLLLKEAVAFMDSGNLNPPLMGEKKQ